MKQTKVSPQNRTGARVVKPEPRHILAFGLRHKSGVARTRDGSFVIYHVKDRPSAEALLQSGKFDHMVFGIVKPLPGPVEHSTNAPRTLSRSARKRNHHRSTQPLRMPTVLAIDVLTTALSSGNIRGKVLIPVDSSGRHSFRDELRNVAEATGIKVQVVRPVESLSFLLGELLKDEPVQEAA